MEPGFSFRDAPSFVILAIVPTSAQEVGEEEKAAVQPRHSLSLFANGDALVEYNVSIEDPLAEE